MEVTYLGIELIKKFLGPRSQ